MEKIDQIIDIIMEDLIITGVHDPCGNAEIEFQHWQKTREKVKKVLDELTYEQEDHIIESGLEDWRERKHD